MRARAPVKSSKRERLRMILLCHSERSEECLDGRSGFFAALRMTGLDQFSSKSYHMAHAMWYRNRSSMIEKKPQGSRIPKIFKMLGLPGLARSPGRTISVEEHG